MPLAFDLHCPWIRGGRNEEIFLVGIPEPWAAQQRQFGTLLERLQQGELVYDSRNDIPYGREWNTGGGHTSTRWLRERFPYTLACTVEFPYAVAGGKTVTAENARAFGADIGRAIAAYLLEAQA